MLSATAGTETPTVDVLAAVADSTIQDSWQATTTATLSASENTGEKPQSKVWTYNGDWFSVLPDSSGTWIWRLDNGAWTPLLQLSSSSNTHADVKAVGNVTHVLLFEGGNTELASVQYVASAHSYQLWSARPSNVGIALPGSSETATIDIDSQGRMWVAYENKSASTVEVRYSDGNYASWSGPITIASGLKYDDISTLVAMGNGQIGVFWSNQNTERFGFRTHTDGADPTQWNALEVPAEQSAKNVGNGMADDHMHLVSASDGTVYAAVKTSYDSSSNPEIALLVRRPDGTWDSLYEVSGVGTRPIVVLNEQLGRLIVAYTERDGGGDIRYRETSTASIAFGPVGVLISGNNYNNVSSTKQDFSDQLLVIASSGSKVRGTLLVGPESLPSAPISNQPPVVSAGTDQTTSTGTSLALSGTVSDDGLPATSLSLQWSQVSGPGQALFGDATKKDTSVTFSAAGTYVLRLTASDGELSSSDDVSVVVVSLTPTGGTSTESTSSLVGFWNFMTGYGANYASQLGAEGSLQGGATVSSDGRLNLGGSGQRYEVNNSPELQISDAITISAWIKPSTKSTQYIVKKAASGSVDGFELGLSNSGTIFVRFNADSAGNSYRVDSSTKYPTNGNTWMHVAATYDGTTIRLYIDGQEQASRAVRFTIATNDLPLTLGSGEGGYRSMRGQLDEVLITDRALSSAEISQVYRGTFSATPPVNQPPSANAGVDRATTVGTAITLGGVVSDDGLPSGVVNSQWSVVSGPGSVSFGNATSPTTAVTFDATGTYLLRLTVSDGELSASDDVVISVGEPTINHAPVGTDATVTLEEGASYTFTTADFGFSDPNDTPAGVLHAVNITTLPVDGKLTLSGVAIAAGQNISVADIAGGKLKYTYEIGVDGPSATSFTFQVQDSGGTANGGVDLDPTPNVLTLNVTASPTLNYVRGLYHEILRRTADLGGLLYWTGQLEGGSSTKSIATRLWGSREHRGIQVDDCYQTYLHRAADSGGRQFWIGRMLNGMTEEEIAAAFVQTREYLAKNPPATDYVMGVYRDLLGRDPSSAELTDWTNKLNNSAVTPAQIGRSIIDSHERHLQLVDGFYAEYLRRDADAGGESYWTNELDKGYRSEADVAIALLSTNEFYNLSQ